MNKLTIFIWIFLCANMANSQVYVDWNNPISGTDAKYGGGIDVDNSGNVYTAGYFFGTIDADPGPGVTSLTAAPGISNIVVTKSNANGDLQWAAELAAPSNCRAYDVTVDGSGNSYVVGSIDGTKAVIIKYSSAGVIQWTAELGSTFTSNYIRTVKLDNTGGIVVGGQFQGTTDFDPGTGVFNLTPSSGIDGFIAKYTDAGAFVWAKAINGAGTQVVWDIDLDASANVYATGYYNGVTDFDPSGATYNLWNDSEDGFVLNLTATGNFVWAKRITGLGQDRGQSIHLDATGDVYISGWYRDDVQYDPGPNAIGFSLALNEDVFVLKTQPNGTGIWGKSFGGNMNDRITSIDINANGNLFMTGNFQSTVDFDPNAGVTNLVSSGANDGFISVMDALGDLQWAAAFGGNDTENSKAITVSASGEVYVSGTFSTTSDFNPGVGVSSLSTVSANADIFTVKYNTCGLLNSSITVSTCDSYTSPAGNIYTTTGNYTDTVQSVQGCDSLIAIQLTINTTPTVSLVADYTTICSGDTVALSATTGAPLVTWNNGLPSGLSHIVVPMNSTTYEVTADDGNGCFANASIGIIVNQFPVLSVLPGDTAVCNGDSLYFEATGASTYYWDYPFGDTINPEWYTPPFDNMYYVYGTDTSGNCESVDSFYVQVNLAPSSVGGGSNGSNWFWVTDTTYNYQWYQDGNLLPGETGYEYIATQDGDYTVQVINSFGCYTEFSWTYSTVGLIESFDQGIRLYPNPTNGIVNIELSEDAELTIYSPLGIRIIHSLYQGGAHTINLDELAAGAYFVEIKTAQGLFKKTIIKQ